MLAYLSGAAIRIGASELDGRANPSAFFFNVPVKLDWRNDPHRAQTLRNLDIAQPLSLDAHNLSSEITLNDSEVRESREFILRLRGKGKISIGLHPGAGKVPNRWAAESFAELANILATELNASIVLTAGPMDDEPLKTVTKRLIVPYELIQNKPIRYVASIILHLNLFVTNDTGLMHVAGATGAPVLSLFGPTDPMQWAPCGTRNRYIVGREGKISSVSVREVLDTAKAMLSQEGRASATT
jgi:heptosyltransferase-2